MRTKGPEFQGRATLLPLTRSAIDGSLRRAAEALIGAGRESAPAVEPEPGRPLPIRPSELVRRLRPFVGLN